MPDKFEAEFELGVEGKPSRTNKVYTKECLEEMARQGNKLAEEGRCLGQIGNPIDGKTDLSKIAVKALPEFHVKEGTLRGKFEILDTDQGRLLKEMMKPSPPPSMSSKFVIRPRIYGNVEEKRIGDKIVYEVVAKDLKVASFDITQAPPDGI